MTWKITERSDKLSDVGTVDAVLSRRGNVNVHLVRITRISVTHDVSHINIGQLIQPVNRNCLVVLDTIDSLIVCVDRVEQLLVDLVKLRNTADGDAIHISVAKRGYT